MYLLTTGCQWRLLPRDFPPYTTVQRFFYGWRDDGTWRRINHHLLLAAREAAGREASPSAGVIDSVNDLPGALIQARRALRPDGLFLAAFVGAGSLVSLRAALRVAEGDRPAARLHPQIDVRSAGDLLMRAGFALPVADGETLNVRYGDLGGLMRDLRVMAANNALVGRRPLRRDTLVRAYQAFADLADSDGRVPERFEIIFMTGWAPAPSQPQPARRGSATTSLAAALKIPDA